jgi:antitoxin CptB
LCGRGPIYTGCSKFPEDRDDEMTGSESPANDLDPRRRRAHFRAWHRGTREMDLLLGWFADAHISGLTDHDLADFEALLNLPDGDLFDFLVAGVHVAPELRVPLLDAIAAFHAAKDQN